MNVLLIEPPKKVWYLRGDCDSPPRQQPAVDVVMRGEDDLTLR